jgi:hypothetical protein
VSQARRVVYQFHISLRDIDPSIWRRVQVWQDTKLPRLHAILQILFNWEDYHLHEFRLGRRFYGEPDPDDKHFGRKVYDEQFVRIDRLLPRVGDELDYVYDFGDNWRHRVLLEAMLLPEADAFYPRCIEGERNGPPEDAGGTRGYASYLKAISDRTDERHEELLQWRGEYDAEAFSLRDVNARLKRTFYRRPRGSCQE